MWNFNCIWTRIAKYEAEQSKMWKKIERVKNKILFPEQKKSEEMFEDLCYTVNNLLGKLGVHTLINESYTPYNFFYFLCIVKTAMYLSFNFYDIYWFRDDYERATFCVVTLGMVRKTLNSGIHCIFQIFFSFFQGISGNAIIRFKCIKFSCIVKPYLGNH